MAAGNGAVPPRKERPIAVFFLAATLDGAKEFIRVS